MYWNGELRTTVLEQIYSDKTEIMMRRGVFVMYTVHAVPLNFSLELKQKLIGFGIYFLDSDLLNMKILAVVWKDFCMMELLREAFFPYLLK